MKERQLSDIYVEKIYQIMRNHKDYNMEIQYILYKKESHNQELQFKAVCISRDEPDDVLGITNIKGFEPYHPIPEWDYNIDTYLFQDLKDGFDILYMPLYIHRVIWMDVHDFRNDIDCVDGLQRYLAYCQKEGINASILEHVMSGKVNNIMDLYNEENSGYKIIAETTCNEAAVVLGYKKDALSEYVTWDTTKDRKGGYLSGHYFTKYKYAVEDYKARCIDTMNKQISKKINKHKIKRKYEER